MAELRPTVALPRGVQRLRARILQTARGGDIEDLKVPLGWNEVPPLFTRGQKSGFDPIGFLRTRSFDRKGREMLRIMEAVFTAPCRRVVRGPVTSFTWPAFPTSGLSPDEQVHRWRCVRFEDLWASAPDGAPLVHRTAIGEDGTWQYFWTEVPPG